MSSLLLAQPDAEHVGRGELRAFWLAHVALGLPRIKTILRRRRILLITQTDERLRRVEVLVSRSLCPSTDAFWLPRRASDLRAFSFQRKTRKRFGVDAKKTTRSPIGVALPEDARPTDAVTVPLSAVIRTLSEGEIRAICGDLGFPFGAAVYRPALVYRPAISDHDAEIKAAKDAEQEAAERAEYVKRLVDYLARRRYSPRIRRAIRTAMDTHLTLKEVAKRAGITYGVLRVTIHRVCRNLAAEMEAENPEETEAGNPEAIAA